MLAELRYRSVEGDMRRIRQSEYELLESLLNQADMAASSVGLSRDLLVEELNDGGMGSLRFHGVDKADCRRFGSAILEGEYYDSDGTLASVAVNIDEQGKLYELDIWKIDFSPTQRFPQPDDMQAVRRV
jgi:hypothetical protein